MNHESTEAGSGRDGSTSMLVMAAMMAAMCIGMALAISLASAVGGPIGWSIAGVVVVGLMFAHLKLMNHGGH